MYSVTADISEFILNRPFFMWMQLSRNNLMSELMMITLQFNTIRCKKLVTIVSRRKNITRPSSGENREARVLQHT